MRQIPSTFAARKLRFREIALRPKPLNRERIEAAKFLVDAEEAGEYGTGGMNAYAKQILGVELRRDFQGIYQAAKLVRLSRVGKIPVSEEELENWDSTPIQWFSGFVSNQPQKVAEALEIIRSRKNVTNRLRELRAD